MPPAMSHADVKSAMASQTTAPALLEVFPSMFSIGS
jgi:hypothetical protein